MDRESQAAKFRRFRELHEGPGIFAIPNPWDAGTARILTALGFEALATTSAGLAFALGRRDSEGSLSRDEILANARDIVEATHLPVSADLENGFGDDPGDCAETVRLAAATGLVGGSIEDASGDPRRPIYDFALAVERVAAAVEAARDLPFLVTARAENFLHGRADLEDTIRRLRAFEAAGADVLYAPGLPDLEAIRQVCAAVSRPVNVVMGLSGPVHALEDLRAVGVRRVSVGGSLARAALGGFLGAAREIRDHGTFTYAATALSAAEAYRYMAETKRE